MNFEGINSRAVALPKNILIESILHHEVIEMNMSENIKIK